MSNLTCKDKAIYKNQSEANAGAIVAESMHNIKLKSYKCSSCGFWHLASK